MSRQVLHVIWSGFAGGAESLVRDYAKLSNRDTFSHTICFLHSLGPISNQMAQAGISVACTRICNGYDLRMIPRLAAVIRNISPDVIVWHSRNYLSLIISWLTPGMRRVYFEHGGGICSPNSGKDRKFYKLFSKHFDKIILNSLYTKKTLLQYAPYIPDKKLVVVHPGIAVERFLMPEGDVSKSTGHMNKDELPIVVGFVGRLVEAKGCEDFISTCDKITRQLSNSKIRFTFLVVGTGPLLQVMKDKARVLNIEICFLGERHDVPDLLKSIDVLLVTSRWDAFGLAVVEALASGVPVVALSCGGPDEILAKGGGVIVSDRNLDSAAAQVVRIGTDEVLRAKLAEEGRRNAASNFSLKKFTENLDKVLESL